MKIPSLILLFLVGLQAHSFGQTNTFPNTGSVGIGTTAPQANLDIFNNTNTTTTPLLSIRSDFHTAGNYGMIRFGDYTQTTNYQKGAIIYESVSGSARGRLHFALENTDGTGSVSITDAKLTILSNGYVGIGIINPQNKLDVNGTLHAKQVNVDLNGWSDYVFKNDYRLPSLTDIKIYIDQNHHLPEIPSEQEIVKNGLNLGEMNKLLVKKVEELTLYLIEKDKNEKEQENRIKKLEQQVQELISTQKH